jgi:hypothetical protein
MGFRFRRSIRIAPGIRVNISKKGVSSVSIGKHGATLNVGKTGVHETIGIPGTGLAYRTDNLAKSNEQPAQPPAQRPSPAMVRIVGMILLILIVALVGNSHLFH